jgi:hypothetical protein
MRRARLVLLLSLGLCSARAFAWDPELHAAIFEAARLISPVLDTRYAEADRSDVLAGLRDADPSDPGCLYHRGFAGRKEAWTSAEELLARIRNPHPSWGPRQKARLFGNYLHYVADCAAPAVAIRDRMKSIPFDIAVYREKRALREPLATQLKERAAETAAAAGGHESVPAAFRAAVNLVLDAALLAPRDPGANEVEDVGPVLMVPVMILAQRVDGTTVESYRMLHAGLHVLEWTTRNSPSGTIVRALVQNNLEFCVRHVFFRLGAWVGGLTVSLPPKTLTVVELPGPAGSPDDVVTRFVPGESSDDPPRRVIPLNWLRLASQERMELRFDRVREFKPGEPGPEATGRAAFVEYLRTDLAAMKGLEIPEFQATARNDRVDFRFRVRNRADKAPKPFFLELEVASTGRPVSELVEVKVDLAKVRVGAETKVEGFVPVKTHGELTALRVFRLRRDVLHGTRPKDVKW